MLRTRTCLTVTNDNDITITPIQTPLLPFLLGNRKIIETKHTFIHYIEVLSIINQLQNIEIFYNQINHNLNKMNISRYTHLPNLKAMMNHTKYLIMEAKTKLNNVQPHTRTKRGLINLGGKVSKWLFGTLDAEDGEKYDKAINELQNSQNSFQSEVNLHMSLTKQLIQNYNETISVLINNQNIIKKHIETLKSNIKKSINDITAFLQAQNTINQIILNCQNIITFLDNLEDAISFAQLNVLHSTVISAKDMSKIISNLTILYGKNKIINFKNLNNYYQIANLQIKFINNKIIFIIHFPIFNQDTYKLYHLFPIPINNTIIIPKQPYLVLGHHLQEYLPEECPMVENIFICHNDLQPITDECSINLIQGVEIQNCQLTMAVPEQPIIEMINNNYIIVIPSRKDLQILKTCKNQEYHLITKPSLVSVPFNCGVQILQNTYWNTENMIKGNPFILPKITFDEITKEKPEEKIKIQSIDLHHIKNLEEKANQLKPIVVNPIHTIAWSSTTTILLIIVTLIIIILWKLRRQIRLKLSQKKTEEVKKEDIPFQDFENKRSPLFSSSVGGVMGIP